MVRCRRRRSAGNMFTFSASAVNGLHDIKNAEINPMVCYSSHAKFTELDQSQDTSFCLIGTWKQSCERKKKDKNQGLPGARTQNLLMTDGVVVVRRLTIGPTDP